MTIEISLRLNIRAIYSEKRVKSWIRSMDLSGTNNENEINNYLQNL